MAKIYDISMPISDALPVWPGDPAISLIRVCDMAKGAACNLTRIEMGSHTGTHVDAPGHCLANGATIDRIPLEVLVGPCMVLEADVKKTIEHVDLSALNFKGIPRVLFKTRNSVLWNTPEKTFYKEYAALGRSGAEFLATQKMVLVGIDYLSIEAYDSDHQDVHKTLLKNNIIILEGLNLSGIQPGVYELLCLPLNLAGCDGAPARVLLREYPL